MLRSLRQGGLVDDEVVIFPKKGVARHSILDVSCYPDDCRCRHLVRACDANAAATLTQKRSRIGVRLGQQDVSGSNVLFTPESGHWATPLGCPLCAIRDQRAAARSTLFDHLVGAHHNHHWDLKSERLGGP